MSRVFESCIKSLLYGCTDCVLAYDCAEKQLYNKGRADAIDECIKVFRNIPRHYYRDELLNELEQLKENNNG